MKKFTRIIIIISLYVILLAIVYANFIGKNITVCAAIGDTKALEKQLLVKDIQINMLNEALLVSIASNQADSFKIIFDYIEKNNIYDEKVFTDINNNAVEFANSELVKILIESNIDKTTLFISAIENGRFDIAQLIFENNIELDIERINSYEMNFNWTWKYLNYNHLSLSEINFNKEDNHKYVLQSMLDKDIYIEELFDGIALIRFYIYTEDYEMLDFLIDVVQNNDISFGLIQAVMYENLNMIKYLIEKGADINSIDATDALFFSQYKSDIFKYLIDIGVPFEGERLNEVLISLATEGNQEIVELLLDKGVDINRPLDERNRTMLFFAAERINVDMVKFCLDNGASIDIVTTSGKSIYDIVKDVRKDKIEWFDISNKKKCDRILSLLDIHEHKN